MYNNASNGFDENNYSSAFDEDRNQNNVAGQQPIGAPPSYGNAVQQTSTPPLPPGLLPSPTAPPNGAINSMGGEDQPFGMTSMPVQRVGQHSRDQYKAVKCVIICLISFSAVIYFAVQALDFGKRINFDLLMNETIFNITSYTDEVN